MQYLNPTDGKLIREPGRPQSTGPVWRGRAQPRRETRYFSEDDRAGQDDVHPDDIATITVRCRGKVEMRRVVMDANAVIKLRDHVAVHGRKALVTVHLKDGGMMRYRGNGRRKGKRRAIPPIGPRRKLAPVPVADVEPIVVTPVAVSFWRPRGDPSKRISVILLGWNGPRTRIRFRVTESGHLGRILSAKPNCIEQETTL